MAKKNVSDCAAMISPVQQLMFDFQQSLEGKRIPDWLNFYYEEYDFRTKEMNSEGQI